MNGSAITIDSIIATLNSDFESNHSINISTPIYKIHIDRQLPYLVIYRRPEEESLVTNTLFSALSSYIELPAGKAHQEDNQRLIEAIVSLQLNYFGNSLLLEIWTTAISDTVLDEGVPFPPEFNIFAPTHDLPQQTLNTLESTLNKVVLRKQHPKVGIVYADDFTPPGQDSLFTTSDIIGQAVCFGLNIKEVFQSLKAREIYPYALKTIQHGLEFAIKKAVYTFSYERTRYKPSHFHVIGRHAFDDIVHQCDHNLAQISEQFDLLLHVTPVNASQAWSEFSDSGYDKIPEFHYRPRTTDPTIQKRHLYQIPVEKIEDPALNTLFLSKRDELDEQIGLINKRETRAFLYSSLQMFGTVDRTLMGAAKAIFSYRPSPTSRQSTYLDAQEFSNQAQKALDQYRKLDPDFGATVSVRKDITGIMVSHGNFLIGADARVSQHRVLATLSHEIGTHALTYHNGKNQPFNQLYSGMAGYEELQEGLAVFGEFLTGGLGYDRLLTLAGRVVAVDSISKGADFIETFCLLKDEYGFYPQTAFYITMRVYRGGGYTKDMIYLRGLIRLIKLISEGVDLELLFAGKLAFEHIEIMDELAWRNIINKPRLLPLHLSDPDSLTRLEQIKRSPTLQTLLDMSSQ